MYGTLPKPGGCYPCKEPGMSFHYCITLAAVQEMYQDLVNVTHAKNRECPSTYIYHLTKLHAWTVMHHKKTNQLATPTPKFVVAILSSSYRKHSCMVTSNWNVSWNETYMTSTLVPPVQSAFHHTDCLMPSETNSAWVERDVGDRHHWRVLKWLECKKDGSVWLCVDHMRLNSMFQFDTYPMLHVDDLIDRLRTSLLLIWPEVTGKSPSPTELRTEKTAFATPVGLFQFTVLPFSLQGAPAMFQRLMDQLVRGLEEFAAAYIDVFSRTWEEHITIWGWVRDTNLTAKAKKCQFGIHGWLHISWAPCGEWPLRCTLRRRRLRQRPRRKIVAS